MQGKKSYFSGAQGWLIDQCDDGDDGGDGGGDDDGASSGAMDTRKY